MIGDSVLLSRIYSPANLGVVSGGNARYYDIQELTIGKSPGALSSSNIDIRYNESASCTPGKYRYNGGVMSKYTELITNYHATKPKFLAHVDLMTRPLIDVAAATRG
ncbi:putative phage related protein [Escherichia coli]|nr:putative phage related protein [Escherichia coli]